MPEDGLEIPADRYTDEDLWQLVKAQLKTDLNRIPIGQNSHLGFADYDIFFRDAVLDRIENDAVYLNSSDLSNLELGLSTYQKLLQTIGARLGHPKLSWRTAPVDADNRVKAIRDPKSEVEKASAKT